MSEGFEDTSLLIMRGPVSINVRERTGHDRSNILS